MKGGMKFGRRLLGGLVECAIMTIITAFSAGMVWVICS